MATRGKKLVRYYTAAAEHLSVRSRSQSAIILNLPQLLLKFPRLRLQSPPFNSKSSKGRRGEVKDSRISGYSRWQGEPGLISSSVLQKLSLAGRKPPPTHCPRSCNGAAATIVRKDRDIVRSLGALELSADPIVFPHSSSAINLISG